ncbi:hypothetical protein HDV00_008135 [Rhizophlyctis rosea]|nr:hypothetical protein HDV00_008135 [Rhizophlyctis rosea]
MAVHYLHSKGIVHRDLKDENIVIDAKYRVKIVDFGSASYIPTHRSDWFEKFNGTAHFASPEVAAGNAYRGPEAEVWSLGVLLFTIIFGENPFQDKEEIVKGEFKYPFSVDASCTNLIERMLIYDHNERATMEEVINHEWIAPEIAALQHHHSSMRLAQRRRSQITMPSPGFGIPHQAGT